MKHLLFSFIILTASLSFAAKATKGKTQDDDLDVTMSAPRTNGPTSEFFYKPGKLQSAVTGMYTYTYVSEDLNLNGVNQANAKVDVNVLELGYQFGFSDYFAMGVSTGYGSQTENLTSPFTTTTSTYKSTGMKDFKITADGSYEFMRFGLLADISPGDAANVTTTSDGNNLYSGGNSYAPYVGVLFNMGAWNFGGKLSDTISQDQKLDTSSGTSTRTPGNQIAAQGFFEFIYGSGIIGAGLEFESGDSSTTTTSYGTTTKSDAYSGFVLSAKGSHYFTNYFALLYSMQMGFANMAPSAGYDKVNVNPIEASVGGRFMF
jgi:hypothetical protein